MRTNRSLWVEEGQRCVGVIDQRQLPHMVGSLSLTSSDDVVFAIQDMAVRGAPLIGATAAFGVWFACLEAETQADPEGYLAAAIQRLRQSRPTAVNLFWALDRMERVVSGTRVFRGKAELARAEADRIVEEDVAVCEAIGRHGLPLLEDIHRRKGGEPVQILTHCNAGRLGCIAWGTATAPLYRAAQQGLPLHVWVDETRPRNQGFGLTAWELGQAGIPHTVIVDNAGGHLMQEGRVDLVLVGTDRTTRTGDAANKIGTYLKALAAKDNGVPFYVALPSATIDWKIRDGLREIPIETRNEAEVHFISGWDGSGFQRVRLTPEGCAAANPAFDVTPSRLISAFITERGICPATENGLLGLFPDFAT